MGSLIGNGFFNPYHTRLLFKGLVSYKDSNRGILRGSGKDYVVHYLFAAESGIAASSSSSAGTLNNYYIYPSLGISQEGFISFQRKPRRSNKQHI
ncbi:hypothetical protein DVH24_021726 [Malus domestica]|uniref:Uncharacterized protein n=1 Tax=Malus domestica TaxID=3750 RepID=A0A498K1X1_MALDO|nr:hypothetical protein DVH24_021726 [Malus domestica]